ncbi:MAG TPA: acetylxylan esterase [Bryobacteraceae bacterium]|nr:acetylxylan esterase [Bryobacteraceae bacterium]
MRVSILLLFCAASFAQAPPSDQMLRSYLTGLAREQLAARRERVAALRTPEEIAARTAAFRRDLLRMMGGLPTEKPPLQLRRTGRLDRGDYRVEKILYQGQPGVWITANLYVPQNGKPPYPAVLHSTGHSQSAKNRSVYQKLSIGLVKHGFVVLTYDPLGQGERGLFFDADLRESKAGATTVEHEMVGTQSLLAGESLARHMIWDGMRGIDLLASLPEVDAARIGATGCSGGGTLTTYIAALDPRVAAAAPACYITGWEDQLQADTGPQDAEQQFPDLLALGYDHGDFVAAFAPKPYLICSTEQDFFPLEGARKTFEEARRIYTLLGAPEKIEWTHDPGGHGMTQGNREGVYGWMKRWLQGGPAGPAVEPPMVTEYEEDLNATPTGQLATSLGGETAGSLNRRRFAVLAQRHPEPSAAPEIARRLTRFERPARPAVHARGKQEFGAYSLERLTIESAGRSLPAALALPRAGSPRAVVLHVSETAALDEFRSGRDLDRLAAAGYGVLAVDVSGRGETASKWLSYSSAWFGREEKEAWLALMTGRTLVGLRAGDIVAALDVLESRKLLPAQGVAGFGKRNAAVDLLHAAAFDRRISSLALEEMPVSWAAVATAPLHRRTFDVIVPGVLGQYDLPDLAAAVAPRPLSIVSARSAAGPILRTEEVKKEYSRAKHARIGLRRETDNVFDAYPEFAPRGTLRSGSAK